MTYSEKLSSPKWQAKRLEILSRANFRCEVCADTEKTLHVHHKSYSFGRDPWDYPGGNFLCLCEDCHAMAHLPSHKPVMFVLHTNSEIKSAVKEIAPIIDLRANITKGRNRFKNSQILAGLAAAESIINEFEGKLRASVKQAIESTNAVLYNT